MQDSKNKTFVVLRLKGTKTEAKNYRPISLLPLISKSLISKLTEKSIHDWTQDYLQKKWTAVQLLINVQ